MSESPLRTLAFRKSWGLALLGLLAAFIVMNALTAILVFRSPGRRMDPVYGDVMNRGLLVSSTEGRAITHINSIGNRSSEPKESRPYSERLLFIGDSFTEAIQIPDRHTFPELVQSSLRQHGNNVVSINAGMDGANPAWFLYFGEALKKTYSPTRTVLEVGDTDFTFELQGPVEKGYWLARDGAEWTVEGAQPPPAAADVARNALTRLPAPYWIWQRFKKSRQARALAPASEPSHAEPNQVEWILRQLEKVYGPDLVVLYRPEIDYAAAANERTETERLVEATAKRLGLTFVNPRDALLDRFAQTRQPLDGFNNTQPGTGHWNVEGHRIVAEQLFKALLTSAEETATPIDGSP